MKKTSLEKRQYILWIVKHAKRTLNHVVYSNIEDMSSGKIKGGTDGTLDYVYCSDITSEKHVSIVSTRGEQKNVYVLRTSKDGEKSQTSFNDIFEATRSLTKKELDALQLQPILKILQSEENIEEKEINSVDFIGLNDEATSRLWQLMVATAGDSIKLTGLHRVKFGGCGVKNENVKNLLLNQCSETTDLSWIPSTFPNLVTLSIWNNSKITEIGNSSTIFPIKELEIHSCKSIDGRFFLSLERFPNLEALILDYPMMAFQRTEEETKFKVNIVDDEEWALVSNEHPLRKLMVNSLLITVDFIDQLLKKFRKLKQFFVEESILAYIDNGTEDGYEETVVLFRGIKDPKQGFSRNRDVRFTNLLSDRYNRTPFSSSMMKIMSQ